MDTGATTSALLGALYYILSSPPTHTHRHLTQIRFFLISFKKPHTPRIRTATLNETSVVYLRQVSLCCRPWQVLWADGGRKYCDTKERKKKIQLQLATDSCVGVGYFCHWLYETVTFPFPCKLMCRTPSHCQTPRSFSSGYLSSVDVI